jgi:hypothetical protein
MAPGFLTSDGGNDVLGFDRRLVAVVAIVGIVAAGGAAAMMVLGGGESTESNAQLDSVPAGVDGLVYVDGNVTEDEFTLETLDGGLEVGWWFVDNSEAPDISVLLETLDTENINYKNTTVFLRGPENGSADYAGSVVNFGEGSSASDMVALLEEELGEDQFEQTTYNGVDVQEVNLVEAAEEADVEGVTDELDVTGIIREFVGVGTTAWVATPDENTVILGSEQAASDAIDVRQGEAEPISGTMRDSHEVAEPGPVEATVSPGIIDQPITEVVGVISNEAATLLDLRDQTPEYLSAAYEVRDRETETITFNLTITMPDSSGAGELFSALKTRYPDSYTDTTEDPEKIREQKALERSAGEKNGKYIHLEIPTLPEQAATYVSMFVDRYGPDPKPDNLVPAAADGVLSIDGNATGDGTTTGIADDALAAGLVAGAEDTTVQDVLDDINAGGVNYTSMTTFYSEDDEDYVGTYVELNKDPNEFIEGEIRGQYRRTTGEDLLPFREHEEGYRHVDVYNLSALDEGQELNITRALSGFIADGTTEWASPISENSLVFGSKEAVQDVADIYRGVAGPAETPLHEAYNRTEGQVVLSGNVSDKPVDGYADAIDSELGDALADRAPEVLSVQYDVADSGGVALDIQFRAADETAAGELADALSEVVEGGEGEAVHERASTSQDGQYVHLSVPYEADQLVEDLEAYVNAFGTELFPESQN